METKQYTELVEKLAGDIIGEALMEKEASAADKAKVIAEEIAEKGKGAAGVVGAKAKAAVNAGKEVISETPDKAKSVVDKARGFAQAHKSSIAAGAVGAGAYSVGKAIGKHEEKQAEEEVEEMEKSAEEQAIAVLEKASAVYEDAQFMKQAALEVLAEAEMYEDAAARIFEEMGLMDEE